MKPGVAARALASELVGRVDREGAWSNVVAANLHHSVDDAQLVRYLLYGTVRNLTRIDNAIRALSSRPVGSIDPVVCDVLRIAFQEVLFGRAPDHAVASVAVEALKERGQGNAAGFVNALVRTLQRQGEPDPPVVLADRFGIPSWLIDDLTEHWGADEARAFIEASHADAPVGFRVRQIDTPRSENWSDSGVVGAYYLDSGDLPTASTIQDPASVAVVRATDPAAGDSVLDIGAAPGGKTIALYDAGPSRVVAVDNHPRRIARAARRTHELEIDAYWVQADGRRLPFQPQTFDRVLLDAPCTGLGTLRRRPEIRHKVTIGERDRLAGLQRQLLLAAIPMVKPGGRLVYSVCTVTTAETSDVVSGVGARAPEGLPGEPLGDGLLLAPHTTGTDAMFIAVIDC